MTILIFGHLGNTLAWQSVFAPAFQTEEWFSSALPNSEVVSLRASKLRGGFFVPRFKAQERLRSALQDSGMKAELIAGVRSGVLTYAYSSNALGSEDWSC